MNSKKSIVTVPIFAFLSTIFVAISVGASSFQSKISDLWLIDLNKGENLMCGEHRNPIILSGSLTQENARFATLFIRVGHTGKDEFATVEGGEGTDNVNINRTIANNLSRGDTFKVGEVTWKIINMGQVSVPVRERLDQNEPSYRKQCFSGFIHIKRIQ